MISVVIVGSGNVAQHLTKALTQSTQVELVQVFARNKASVSGLLPEDRLTDDFSRIASADLYIVSVSDDAIASVCESLPLEGKLVVHTSGTKPMDLIPTRFRRGVFYPLQTFSKKRSLDYSDIPFCLEAENPEDFKTMELVVRGISANVYAMNSAQRKALHVAAVFVSNFANHLYGIGQDICEQHQIPFDVLKPLIAETAHKIVDLKPKDAQTGPAVRRDQGTIDAHIDFLKDSPYRELYEKLTQSIQNE